MSYPSIHIAGVGITRFGKQLDLSVKDLVRQAVTMALEDAGCELTQIQAAYFGTAGQGLMEGQTMVAGQIALRAMGISGIPVTNVENASPLRVPRCTLRVFLWLREKVTSVWRSASTSSMRRIERGRLVYSTVLGMSMRLRLKCPCSRGWAPRCSHPRERRSPASAVRSWTSMPI